MSDFFKNIGKKGNLPFKKNEHGKIQVTDDMMIPKKEKGEDPQADAWSVRGTRVRRDKNGKIIRE